MNDNASGICFKCLPCQYPNLLKTLWDIQGSLLQERLFHTALSCIRLLGPETNDPCGWASQPHQSHSENWDSKIFMELHASLDLHEENKPLDNWWFSSKYLSANWPIQSQVQPMPSPSQTGSGIWIICFPLPKRGVVAMSVLARNTSQPTSRANYLAKRNYILYIYICIYPSGATGGVWTTSSKRHRNRWCRCNPDEHRRIFASCNIDSPLSEINCHRDSSDED